MNATENCQQCSSPLPPDAPGGVCPQCLLGLGMVGPNPNQQTATMSDNVPYPVPSAEQLVNRFPDLEILHLIGQGGMGAVYQARQKNLDRLVALKILSPRLGSDPTFAQRFMREARTLAKLSHPNIVTVFNFGQTDEMYYLVMEFVDGVNLRDTIQAKTLDPDKALAVVPQICDALQYAHDKGVVHRDIKPENILVDTLGRVKIADFGLAKLLEPTAAEFTLTNTRQVMGTLKYMAPEQIEKPEFVDHRADLYSLGVVFYELLTGELPLGRFSLPSEKANVNGQLDDVVMKTLEKEPDRRYQQASQIKSAVADARQTFSSTSPASGINPGSYSETPKLAAVPFTTDDIHWGMANVLGLITIADDNTLELEFEVRDSLGGSVKSAPRFVDIPINRLTNVTYGTGFFSHRIELQAETMSVVSDIPTSQQGAVKLHIKKTDEHIARQMVEFLRAKIGIVDTENRTPVSPTAPVKRNTTGIVLIKTMRATMLFFGLGVCVIGMLVMLWYFASKEPSVPKPASTASAISEHEELPNGSSNDPELPSTPDISDVPPIKAPATLESPQPTETDEDSSKAIPDPPTDIFTSGSTDSAPPLSYSFDRKLSVLVFVGCTVFIAFSMVIGIVLWLLLRKDKTLGPF